MNDQDNEQQGQPAIAPIGLAMAVPQWTAETTAPNGPLVMPSAAGSAKAPNAPAMAVPPAIGSVPANAAPPSAPAAMPLPNNSPAAVQPPAMQVPRQVSATQGLLDRAKQVKSPFERFLAETGSGILRGLDLAAESIAPKQAMLIPGSQLNTNLRNQQAFEREQKQQAMAIDQEKADADRIRAEATKLPQSPWKLSQSDEGTRTNGQTGQRERFWYNDQTGETKWLPEGMNPTAQASGPAMLIPSTAVSQSSAAGQAPQYTYGKPPAPKEGQEPATKGALDTLRQSVEMPGLSAQQKTDLLSWPEGYTPTADDIKERQAMLDRLATAQTNRTQQRFLDELRNQTQAIQEQNSELRQQTAGANPGWAYDPQSKQKVLTTQDEAQKNGYTHFMKSTPADIEKDEGALRQMNDVQLNVSRYRMALDAIPGNISKAHVSDMERILTDKDLNSFITNGATLGTIMDEINQGEKANAWNGLTPGEQNAVVGYIRAKSSMVAYQRALAGTGRTNKEALELEMANIPSPIMGATAANRSFNAFQENIDTASQGFGRLPWLETPEDVRKRVETSAAPASKAERTGGASRRTYSPDNPFAH